jgi:uncharacterized protein (DUF2237 family)
VEGACKGELQGVYVEFCCDGADEGPDRVVRAEVAVDFLEHAVGVLDRSTMPGPRRWVLSSSKLAGPCWTDIPFER